MSKGGDQLTKTLNTLAGALMDQVPNDVKSKADQFVKEVAKSVDAVIADAEKRVTDAEAKASAAESRLSKGRGKADDELFVLRDVTVGSFGTWPALYRKSHQSQPLFCFRLQRSMSDPMPCSTHCAGFKILNDGNVELCNGSVRVIERG